SRVPGSSVLSSLAAEHSAGVAHDPLTHEGLLPPRGRADCAPSGIKKNRQPTGHRQHQSVRNRSRHQSRGNRVRRQKSADLNSHQQGSSLYELYRNNSQPPGGNVDGWNTPSSRPPPSRTSMIRITTVRIVGSATTRHGCHW